MATLTSKSGDVRWSLEPAATREVDNPVWLDYTHLLVEREAPLFTGRVALTDSDVVELARLFIRGPSPGESFESTDADLLLLFLPVEAEGDLAVAVFVGEPYGLMKGYRFVVQARQLEDFGVQLRSDLEGFLLGSGTAQ